MTRLTITLPLAHMTSPEADRALMKFGEAVGAAIVAQRIPADTQVLTIRVTVEKEQ